MNIAVILAAGKSERMSGTSKMLAQIAGQPLIIHTLRPFFRSDIAKIILVVPKEEERRFCDLIQKQDYPLKPEVKIISGGETRFSSAKNGFLISRELCSPNDIIIFHNGANPLVSSEEICLCLDEAYKSGACVTGHFATDTLKRVRDGHIAETLPREEIIHAQTPQAFRVDLLDRAYKKYSELSLGYSSDSSDSMTDEAMIIELLGHKVRWIPASPLNRKVTTREDLLFVSSFLGELTYRSSPTSRIGMATDSHRFDRKRNGLIFGTLYFEDFPRLIAESDGDIVLHAVVTALSQALGGGSLGTFADDMCKQGLTESKHYLAEVLTLMQRQNLFLSHLGLHFECGIPKIDPLSDELRVALSTLLHLKPEAIGITATSGEDLSAWGKGEGIRCTAAVLLAAHHPTS